MIPGQDHLCFQFKNFPQDFPPTCKDKPLLEADSVTGEMMDFYLSSNNRLSPGYKFCMPSLKWLALRTLVYTILWEVLSCMEGGGGTAADRFCRLQYCAAIPSNRNVILYVVFPFRSLSLIYRNCVLSLLKGHISCNCVTKN